MKSHLGAIADEKFRQIVPLFSFHDLSDLRYPPGGSKIEVYINRNHPESINWAYWGGFIITVRSSDLSGFWYDYAVYTVRHELTHVFEFLIEGRHTLASEYWFKEGIAVHVGCLESSLIKKIDSLNELGAWISENQNLPGQGNPIKIHRSEDFPSGANRDRYNRLFELAVRYLIDGRGLGKSYRDVLRLFYDLRDGKSFAASFQDKLGMSVVDYENSFYSRMRTYLGGGQG